MPNAGLTRTDESTATASKALDLSQGHRSHESLAAAKMDRTERSSVVVAQYKGRAPPLRYDVMNVCSCAWHVLSPTAIVSLMRLQPRLCGSAADMDLIASALIVQKQQCCSFIDFECDHGAPVLGRAHKGFAL